MQDFWPKMEQNPPQAITDQLTGKNLNILKLCKLAAMQGAKGRL
jgi:hypothetical protein